MEGFGGRSGGVRVVEDYILGDRIGAGSFAVVWRARHRLLGVEVAVKEIDKKQLSSKLKESLFQEIDILRNICHPNIIRLHEAIQTEEKIYLVLEYCTGGDLAAYIKRHGRVSETVARQFMQQLASGLLVLRENNLIHRDLKPQNLLLSSRDENSILKIGDFGFARYLMPQRLADTLCGSPLYMAPEIIQNQKYDAKADLWSVGAILFQLVTGKPPFEGNSQLQLFRNILASNELHFPHSLLEELQDDCIDLCKSLLRVNPVERLTFEEFFSHKFVNVQRTSGVADEALYNIKNDKLKNLHKTEDNKLKRPLSVISSSSFNSGVHKLMASVSKGDSLDSFEWEYVVINPNLTSMEIISSSPETSLLKRSMVKPVCVFHQIDKGVPEELQTGEPFSASISGLGVVGSDVPDTESSLSMQLTLQRTSLSHPSKRLQLLCQYLHALSEVSKKKLSAGLYLESFSVELVSLAVWKEALRICSAWLSSTSESTHHISPLEDQESDEKHKSISLSKDVDFGRPETVYSWLEQGFLASFDRAEMISNYLQDMDGNSEMPDAMEILFQTALAAGKRGAVDELMGNGRSAVAAYSMATGLLSFILMEATSLPLNPPFSLPPSAQRRICKYITSLRAHLNQPR